jgi:hypothetical protein
MAEQAIVSHRMAGAVVAVTCRTAVAAPPAVVYAIQVRLCDAKFTLTYRGSVAVHRDEWCIVDPFDTLLRPVVFRR